MEEQNQQRQRQQPAVPPDQGLYSFANEHDACGVGMAANLNNVPEHRIVEAGLTVLKNLMHRGAAGNDPETGDGAGLLMTIPHRFFHRIENLPPVGQYGVAMMFGGVGRETEIEEIVKSKKAAVLTWRDVPTAAYTIGKTAQTSCPVVRQLFIGGESFADRNEFERKLFVIRRLIEKNVPDVYICSCSSRSIVYKGLLLATQLEKFYPDLNEPDFEAPVVVVHQRYSTNTFPTWNLAHPFRYLAHNGEINTLRGNLNHLRGREPYLQSELLGNDLKDILPLIGKGVSDSAALDNMFELLTASGRSLCHSMLMLIPQAWGKKYYMGRDVRGFFEYHSALMEPWDGPAAVAFTDGVNAGAVLDRNGLRPARYTLCDDGLFILASETGVLDIPPEKIVRKGRLKPGEIIYCDLEHHRLIEDAELKNLIARRQPYRRWVDENRISVHGLFASLAASEGEPELLPRQKLFGYTREDMEMIIKPMCSSGHEPLGSMGNDAALAVLSERPQLLFNYFKQLFAQVTNPPIDPIREELVMSLTTYLGNRGNILAETPEHAKLIRLPRPVLTDDELRRLYHVHEKGFEMMVLQLGFRKSLRQALEELADNALAAVRTGSRILVLSDRSLASGTIPIPSLLATAAVNRALTEAGVRSETSIIVESGEVREIMHFALLLGYGATAVNPYLALASVSELVRSGEVRKDDVTAAGNYINAVDKGILKVMSKMGISTLRSYRSAQLFEAVGLDMSVMERYFPGTASRVGGIRLEDIEQEARKRYQEAQVHSPLLPEGGSYRFRRNGEHHLWTPESLSAFRQAVQGNDVAKYREYAAQINDQAKHLCTLRGLFEFVPGKPVDIGEVESVESIIRHFVSGAMSLGSLSPEAHEAIAVAMNRLGAMSNCGEGGEDPKRNRPGEHGEDRSSAIKQIASGRFGVTIDYLRHARELQIKMAQGAKPGEGGQLPGHKVDEFIASIRHSTPQVSLISPPPHHDIYSIEDLAQLIYDLRNANPKARVSVKLVSEVGVGTIAAGVAKAHADVILISGHDGGTGASPLTSIKHAGLPWELGLAEAHQTLVMNHLRDHVRLQVDGQLKTGRDVVIGALLGAEEFGFATTLLVCLGCVMMRKCHDNSCPVGVATQDPELRKCFKGKPEYIENFLRMLAGEIRETLASLGLKSLDDAVGRTEFLQMSHAIDFYKHKGLDFSKIFVKPEGGAVRYRGPRTNKLANFDRKHLLRQLQPNIEKSEPAEMDLKIHNTDRSVGTELSGEIVEQRGAAGLPENTIRLRIRGCAGQSFGAFLARGVRLELIGEANDFVGKGLSGGTIVIRPPENIRFKAEDNVIAGNVIGYGGTAGKLFINGQAGERFCIRNSGITAVVEGVGDHGCEYMTGGRVVVLGHTGVNFAAGMTGGIAYVLDGSNDFDLRCNIGTIDLETIQPESEDEKELQGLLREHLEATGSRQAEKILGDWVNYRNLFVKVYPVEYRQAMMARGGKA